MIPISALTKLLDRLVNFDGLRTGPGQLRADWFGTFTLSADDHESFATLARIASGETIDDLPSPATPTGSFGCQAGGTGRFDLTIDTPPGVDGPVVLMRQLSRSQAERFCERANAVMAIWAEERK